MYQILDLSELVSHKVFYEFIGLLVISLNIEQLD